MCISDYIQFKLSLPWKIPEEISRLSRKFYSITNGRATMSNIHQTGFPAYQGNQDKLNYFFPVREFEKNALNQGKVWEF